MGPEDVHVADQLDAYWHAHANRLGQFYGTLRRRHRVPALVAAVLVVIEAAGYHWSGAGKG